MWIQMYKKNEHFIETFCKSGCKTSQVFLRLSDNQLIKAEYDLLTHCKAG